MIFEEETETKPESEDAASSNNSGMLKISRLKKKTSTYMPVLIKIAQMTKGPIMESGSGFFNTPLLHWPRSENKREPITYENNPEFYAFVRELKSYNHKVRLVQSFDEVDFSKQLEHCLG